jgi:hypothetical protein
VITSTRLPRAGTSAQITTSIDSPGHSSRHRVIVLHARSKVQQFEKVSATLVPPVDFTEHIRNIIRAVVAKAAAGGSASSPLSGDGTITLCGKPALTTSGWKNVRPARAMPCGRDGGHDEDERCCGSRGRAAMLTMMLSTVALAQNAGNTLNSKDAADKFSQSNSTCAAYVAFISYCLKKEGNAFEKMGKEFLNRAYISGMMAGLSEQALTKRVEAATSRISADTKNNCDNVDMLLEKHGAFCKAFFRAGPSSDAMMAKPK